MGGEERVAAWAERQRSKALHVGTYEAAVHNMLRRIHDQNDHGALFYLYRVHLKPTIVVRGGWLIDPSNFVGDVILEEVCPPGIHVARYLNYHEDPGGISLALGRDAIASVQQIAVPPDITGHDGWIARTVTELTAAIEPPLILQEQNSLDRFRKRFSPQSVKAREIISGLAPRLPVNLRSSFQAATALSDAIDHETWARYVVGLMGMIEAPQQVLAKLDMQDTRAF